MSRARNPRVVSREKMMEIKRWVNYMTNVWQVGREVFVPHDQRKPGDPHMRPRQPDEYPENDAEAWTRLAKYMRAVIVRASEVQEIAERNARKLRTDAAARAVEAGE